VSPVPQPWSIFAEPVKVGDEWYVLARHPSGQHVHVRRFKTQGEASFGSPESQKLGSKNRATSMTSRQMKDSGLPASSKYRRDSVDRHQFDGEAGTDFADASRRMARPADAHEAAIGVIG
jgi:hypothetical protein